MFFNRIIRMITFMGGIKYYKSFSQYPISLH